MVLFDEDDLHIQMLSLQMTAAVHAELEEAFHQSHREGACSAVQPAY